MAHETILYTKENGIATITLNRPQALNAFVPQMNKEVLEVLKEGERDKEVRCFVITGAGRIPLPTRFIVHAVGPRYSTARDEECATLLRSAHEASLRLCDENAIRSVAFPAISTGVYGYPIRKAAPIALGAAADHLSRGASSLELIVFVLFTPVDLQVFSDALAALTPGRA